MLLHLLEVELVEEVLENDVLLFELAKKLLSVTPRLRAGPSYYMLLHEFPLFAEEL